MNKKYSKEYERLPKEYERLPKNEKRVLEAAFDGELPIPVGQIGESLGLKIYEVDDLPNNISGEIRPCGEGIDTFEINIAKYDLRVRKRFTVAHEIAHYLLHRNQIGESIEDDVLYRSKLSHLRETEANRLAADILLPLYRVHEEHEKIKNYTYQDKLEILSSIFAVSGTAMKIRLERIGVYENETLNESSEIYREV